MASRRVRTAATALVLAALTLTAGVGLGRWLDPTDGPRRLPPFRYVDQEGRAVTPASLLGHVAIADLTYTRCTGACPALAARMARLRRALPDGGFRFVSFSIDPERDRPADLAAYARRFGPADARWLLLATDAASLPLVTDALGLSAAGAAGHSERFALIDAAGLVRGTYDAGEDGALAADARALAP